MPMAILMNDPQLAARIRKGDPEALQAIAQAYLAQIFRSARGASLDPEDAEEVTQATFTTFIEKAAGFEGRSHVRTWLFGILYNKIAEARRHLTRERHLDSIAEEHPWMQDDARRWWSLNLPASPGQLTRG